MKLFMNVFSEEESQFTWEYNHICYIRVASWFVQLKIYILALTNASFENNSPWVILGKISQEFHIFSCISLKALGKKVDVLCMCIY